MKQVFHTYEKWEDYKNGMYSLEKITDDSIIDKSVILLSNPQKFYDVCKKLIVKWPVASAVNLTNKNQNRRAWLGAAACSFNHNSTEIATRISWSMLDDKTQNIANKIAERVIIEYERENSGIHSNMGTKVLF